MDNVLSTGLVPVLVRCFVVRCCPKLACKPEQGTSLALAEDPNATIHDHGGHDDRH